MANAFKLKPMRSRRLFFLMAFLFLDIDSENSSVIPFIENDDLLEYAYPFQSVSDYHGKNIWLLDEDSGKCLGYYGFAECGDSNLFKVLKSGLQSVRLQFAYLYPESLPLSGESLCLGRRADHEVSNSVLPYPSLTLSPCGGRFSSYFSGDTWDFDVSSGRLSFKPMFGRFFFTSVCVAHGSEGAGNMALCSNAHAKLRPIVHEAIARPNSKPQRGVEESASLSAIAFHRDVDIWRCPHSGVVLPRRLDEIEAGIGAGASSNVLNNADGEKTKKEHIFMGGGVFTKRVFNYDFKVYTVGLYVEAVRATVDHTLLPFVGIPASSLSEPAGDFYRALVSPHANYDRSLVLKLAMTLPKKAMLEGLMDELGLQKKNAQLLFNASQAYEHDKAPRDFVMIFTWRAPAVYSEQDTGSLEIRMGGKLYATISEPGLAQDFFTQFVCDDPVSRLAKARFTDGFPTLLSGDQTYREKAAASLEDSDVSVTRALPVAAGGSLSRRRRLFASVASWRELAPSEDMLESSSPITSPSTSSAPSTISPKTYKLPTAATVASDSADSKDKGYTYYETYLRSFWLRLLRFIKSRLLPRMRAVYDGRLVRQQDPSAFFVERVTYGIILLNLFTMILISLPAARIQGAHLRARAVVRGVKRRLKRSLCKCLSAASSCALSCSSQFCAVAERATLNKSKSRPTAVSNACFHLLKQSLSQTSLAG